MSRAWLRPLAGGAAIVLALALAVLAGDVRRWPGRIEDGDVAYAAAPGGRDAWQQPESTRARLAGDLLAVDDDLRLRRGLQLVARGRAARFALASRWTRLVAETETVLADVLADRSDPRRRAIAANLLGVVYYDAALSSNTRRNDFLHASLNSFKRAVRLDRSNTDAKHNLELLLTILRLDRNPGGRRGGGSGGGQRTGEDAGLRLPGTGY